MSTNDKKEINSAEQPEGIDVSNVTFDPDGKVNGLTDEALDGVAGGLMDSNNGSCPQANVGSCG